MKKYSKSLFWVALVVSQIGWAAPGDPFDITQDGITYHCVAPGHTNPGGVLDCVNKAYSGIFSRDEATQLCSGAFSTAPVDCANKAYSGPYSRQEAISLCTYATSNGPVECANQAYSGPFSRDESLQLCSRDGSVANAQCAIRAYAGPYTKAQAITMCRAHAELLNVALSALHNEAMVGFNAVLQKSLVKAQQQMGSEK